jgi:hypothetical protein
MNFMKWLSSLDEFLYEVVSWLAFYPLTLWRAISRPLTMMEYAEAQLSLPPEEQFLGAISPPLFLVVTLLVAHGIDMALGNSDPIVANKHGLAALIPDDASAIFFRALVFAAFPLAMAARCLRRLGGPFDREQLKGPFYAQCYPTAAFALALSFGGTLADHTSFHQQIAGGTIIAAAIVCYLATETSWFAAKLGRGLWGGFLAATLSFGEGFVLLVLAAFLVAR